MSAQNDYREGYIVDMSGDTSHGWIDYGNPKSNAKYCLFKETHDSESKAYYPDDLSVYRFANSKFYFSKEIERTGVKKRYFLEYLLDGVVELYYHADPFKDYFYIEKDGRVIELSDEEKIVDLKNGKGKGRRYVVPFTGVFNYVMHDAPEMKEKISRARFGYDDFIELSEEYHHLICEPGEECIVYARQETKLNDIQLKWRFGIALGNTFSNTRNLISNSPRVRYFHDFTDENQIYPRHEAQITGDLSNIFVASKKRPVITNHYVYPALSLNVSNKWRTSLQVEVQMHNNTFEIQGRKTQLQDLEMLLLVHRNFSYHTKLKPFVEFGLTFYKSITRSIENNPISYNIPVIIDGDLSSRMDIEIPSHDVTMTGNQPNAGAAIGFGLSYTLENEHQIELKLLWDYHEEKDQGFISDEFVTNQKYFVNNFLIQLGYRF